MIEIRETQTIQTKELPDHLVRMLDRQWSLWRCVGLRGAGFPASLVLKLAAEQCAAAADSLLREEEREQASCACALDVVREELDGLRDRQQWDDLEKRQPLVQALRTLKKGKLPAIEKNPSIKAREAIEDYSAAKLSLQAAQRKFAEEYEAAALESHRACREIALTDRFREAVIWQNRHAFHTGVASFLTKPAEKARQTSKQRQHEELIASYLQRYCVKNDTIGFFGPVGWAAIVSEGEALRLRPGPALLAERDVYFEGWCIDALAEKLARHRDLRRWFAPRRLPTVHLEGALLYTPFAQPMPLSPELAALLQACDGESTAQEIALSLINNPVLKLRNVSDVYLLLDHLNTRKLISWTLEVPLELYPERTLRRLVERLGDEEFRRRSLENIDALEAGRRTVAAASGRPAALDQALEELEATFTRITEAAPTRAAGEMYAARTLVYEDCRRDLEAYVGPELMQALEQPLSLLLTSARWMTFQLAAIYRRAFTKVYEELLRKGGSPRIGLANFWYAIQPLLFEEKHSPLADLVCEFQARWAGLLSSSPEGRRVEYSSEDLRAPVLVAFDAPAPGWRSARYHSPDLMIAADCLEAILRGQYEFVLGEFHVGVNTLRGMLFVAQHPKSEALYNAYELDLPEARVVPIAPKNWPGLTARTLPTLVTDKDFRLMVTQDSFGAEKGQPLPIGALVIEESGGELHVRTRDEGLRFDVIEVFADLLSGLIANSFKIMKPAPHTPRVSFDRLVVNRETWRCSAGELDFAFEKEGPERFKAARRWSHARKIPRFVFVKAAVEVKPFYVDFDSPHYVNIFAKVVRRTTENKQADQMINITEMLPQPEQVWLPDTHGQLFTSELRLVALDQKR